MIVFPAGAGVILLLFILLNPYQCFPRRCGGDPRLWHLRTAHTSVFPAGAGVILIPGDNKFNGASFPRRCGGDPDDDLFMWCGKAFSPQVRG